MEKAEMAARAGRGTSPPRRVPAACPAEDGLREAPGEVKQTRYRINCTVHVPKQDDRSILQDVLYTISLLKQATFGN